jgi:hypothetical protein
MVRLDFEWKDQLGIYLVWIGDREKTGEELTVEVCAYFSKAG